jgi:hypothetical protein
MKFPKLHLVCSDEELRPALSVVKVDKEFTFSSDAHILVRHKTSELFKVPFVESLPHGGIMVPRNAIAILCRKSTFEVSLSDDKRFILLHQKDGSIIQYKLYADGGYPDANKIIPDPKDCKPLSEIGLNSSLLDRLSDGLGCNDPILHLRFYSQTKAILCSSSHTDYVSAIGIIMPVNINNRW